MVLVLAATVLGLPLRLVLASSQAISARSSGVPPDPTTGSPINVSYATFDRSPLADEFIDA